MGRHRLGYLGAAVLACAVGCGSDVSPLCIDGQCNLGETCSTDSDCFNSECVDRTCTQVACEDGVQGEQETDVDCGGGTCGTCAGGRHCLADRDCASGTCVAGANTCSQLATMAFADAVHYPSGDKTYALFAGDLDGDGHVDLVAANEQANSLSVFLNRGDGTGVFQSLASGFTSFQTGAYPTGGAIADFNHDGIPDVVTADYHGDSVSVLLGTPSAVGSGKGTGVLTAKTSYPAIDSAETSNLDVADLDGDGNLDVITANPAVHLASAASVSVFMGRADGTLGPPVTTPIGTGSLQPYAVAIGDFNGDGKQDVAISDLVNGPIVVKLGNGDGTFQPQVLYSAGGHGATIIITRDMNLDGKLDLVCANRGSSDVSVLLGRGDGTFRRAIVSTTGPGTSPFSIAVADFNLDGVPDVVTANYMTGNGSVLLGIGNGRFEAPINTGPTALKGGMSYGVAVGDFNGDGKPDFATTNPGDNDISVKLSTSH
jgi:FG-GAP-like repeat/FG-GAP repeat